jgi:predicted lipoprotein
MRKIVLFAILAITVLGCSSSDNDGGTSDNFNRTQLLTIWADVCIVPNYMNYKNKLDDLYFKASLFHEGSTKTQEQLDALRAAWLDAYKAYQYVGMFDIGPAETQNLKGKANTFPADVAGIQANITSGNYNLALFSQFDKQGFPALDYLINGVADDDAGILAYYSGFADSNRIQYLIDCVSDLQSVAQTVVMGWDVNGGNYRQTFINNDGNSVSSSVNKMTNLFVKYLEKDIRTGKIGIPAGLFSNGTTFPDKVEAYYKGDLSRELLLESLEASFRFFNSMSVIEGLYSVDYSLKKYLDHVDAMRDGQPLSEIINDQYMAIYNSNNTLNENLSQQIFSDNTKMIAAYDVVQQQVVYVKLDMLQALNITIDYVDGDGD